MCYTYGIGHVTDGGTPVGTVGSHHRTPPSSQAVVSEVESVRQPAGTDRLVRCAKELYWLARQVVAGSSPAAAALGGILVVGRLGGACAVGRPHGCQLCVNEGPSRLEVEHGDLIGPVPYLKEEEVCRQLKHKRGARGGCTASQRTSTKGANNNSYGKVIRAGEELWSVGGEMRPAMVVCSSFGKGGEGDSAELMNWPVRTSWETNTAFAGGNVNRHRYLTSPMEDGHTSRQWRPWSPGHPSTVCGDAPPSSLTRGGSPLLGSGWCWAGCRGLPIMQMWIRRLCQMWWWLTLQNRGDPAGEYGSGIVSGSDGGELNCLWSRDVLSITVRVSTEFRRHGIPSVFFTSVYSVFRAELAKIPAEFRRIPCHIIPWNSAEFHGIPWLFSCKEFRISPKCTYSWYSFERPQNIPWVKPKEK